MNLAAASSAAKTTPRAYLGDMFTLPGDYELPDLSLVRSQAAKVIQLARTPVPPRETIGTLPTGLWYRSELPQLFEFSYFCSIDDVPEDILPPCIWALEWWIRALLEGSDEQLKPFTRSAERGKNTPVAAETQRYVSLKICRLKVAEHFLHPQINQPLEALYHIRCSMEAVKKRRGISDLFDTNPGLYILCAVCLARARIDDLEAKTSLSRIIRDPTFDAGEGTIAYHVQAKVYLARVFRRLGEDSEAHKLEVWLVKWFKKHPHTFNNAVLIQMFTTDIDPAVDPVFTGLGGLKWLNHRKATVKTIMRQSKYCYNCRASEAHVKLLKCLQCQRALYCSKECQKMNWAYHKTYFRQQAEQFKKIAEVERISASAAQKLRDWTDYRDNPKPETLECFAHALGLARDASRGRTHIVYQEVEYVPSIKNRLDRFRTKRIGVYRFEDVWQDLGSKWGLDIDESRMGIRQMLDEVDREPGSVRFGGEARIPIFYLIFSANIHDEVYLKMRTISQRALVSMQPRSDWRRDMNVKGEPPGHIKLNDGKIPDAEFIF
ncbi:hypothetical protein ARMGADRAFT_986089 [Armillaria gallica]|uniref:MYND-type domain-containing protein n=1 Tax=Armillaria gallica TaxID=47427 RepID=A0A2H3DS60_ARMGA|nr:hypothetical protein ARMGADRAFT_986089 [Armillaria gallica]